MKPFIPYFMCCLLAIGCSHKSVPEPIWIGHVSALSGPDQALGRHARQGILLAVEDANKEENRIEGRKVAVQHADSRGDPTQVRPLAVRLLTVDKVSALLLGPEAGAVEDLGSIAAMYNVPTIMTTGLLEQGGNDFLFYTGLPPTRRGQILAGFAAQKKVSPLLILAAADNRRPGLPPGQTGSDTQAKAVATQASALVDAFTKEFRKAGGTLAGEPYFYKDPAEFKSLASQGKAGQPGAILLAGPVEDLVALDRAGWDDKVPLFLGGEEERLATLQAAQLTHPIFLASVFMPEGRAGHSQEFFKVYQERFSEAPDMPAAMAYDNARLLFQALRQAKSTEGSRVQKPLADLQNYESLTGPLSFGKDHVAIRPVFIVSLKQGRLESVPFETPSK